MSAWPALDGASWPATKKSLHLYTQMLGKLRVALSPPQPNWLHTALLLTARGLTTGPLPAGSCSVQATLDVFSSELVVDASDGRSRRIALVPARPVAEVFADLLAALRALEIDATLSPLPQEIADVTPLDADRRPATYDPATVQEWFRIVTATGGVFERARARFFGRSGIQLWWGALDVALLFFSGKRVAAPTDRGYLLRYDLDAEMLNVGFYPGDDASAPFFYGYIFPQPADAPTLPVDVPGVTWSESIHEWLLPYETVRSSADPAALVLAFIDALYALCGTAAGWDLASLSYLPPKRAPRG
jgi:hypothetical protein